MPRKKTNTEIQPTNTQGNEGTKYSVSVPIWIGILVVYGVLFFSTGYIAFIMEEFNPIRNFDSDLYRELHTEAQAIYLDAHRAESETFNKKRELASQSFNVVLGALLGFLSASATSAFRRKSNP